MGIAAACLLVSFALIGWAVVMRYVFNAAPIWVDEVVGRVLVANMLLRAAQTLRRGEPIGVDLVRRAGRTTCRVSRRRHCGAACTSASTS